MLEDKLFAVDDAISSNLRRLAEKRNILDEQRLLELYELSSEALDFLAPLAAEGLSAYELLESVREGADFGLYEKSELALPENQSMLSHLGGSLRSFDRAVFSSVFSEGLRKRGYISGEGDFLPPAPTSHRFTYSRNSLSDEAYAVFTEGMNDASVVYSTDFRDCVNRLIQGECDFCLLPLEERGGVRLPTVGELIFRNEIYINAVTPVFGFDGNADLKYAMLSRGLIPHSPTEEDERYVELRIPAGGELEQLCSALPYLGLELYRVNSLTYVTEGERADFYSVILRDLEENLCALCCYLALFCEDGAIVGFYKNLE